MYKKMQVYTTFERITITQQRNTTALKRLNKVLTGLSRLIKRLVCLNKDRLGLLSDSEVLGYIEENLLICLHAYSEDFQGQFAVASAVLNR